MKFLTINLSKQLIAVVAILTTVLLLGYFYSDIKSFANTQINRTIISNPDLERGLVGHWTFDGNDVTTSGILDRSKNNNHGWFVGGATTSALVPGKIGQAMVFDGSDDYVDFGNPAALDLAEDEPIALVSWVRVDAFPGNGNLGDIMSKGLNVSDVAAYGMTISEDGFVDPTLTVGSFNLTDGDQHATTSIASWSLGEWHHVVGQYTGSQWELYVDGVLEDTTVDNGPENTDQDFLIGAFDSNGTPARFFNGTIDDARIYNRALSAEEIGRLYELGATTKINKTITSNNSLDNGLVGHWTFDGNLNDQITDESGNGNQGSISGSATATMQAIGKIGQGLEFDGSDDYIFGSTLTSIDEPLTLCGWIKIDPSDEVLQSGTAGTRVIAVVRNTSGTAEQHSINLNKAASTNLRAGAGSLDSSDGNGSGANGSTNIFSQGSVWQHVCGRFNSSTSRDVFINGVLDGTNTGSEEVDNIGEFIIGGTGGSDRIIDSFTFGKIDDVRVYNRALSAEEIGRLYELGATTKINKTITSNNSLDNGLVGHWTFDGNLDAQITDESGNGNHGSISGSATATMQTVGKIGQGLEFDGVDDVIEIKNDASINFDGNSDSYTMGLWVKSADPTQDSTGRLLEKWNLGGGYAISWIVDDNGGADDARANIYDGSTSASVNFGDVWDGEWHQLLFVVDNASDFLYAYTDGSLFDSAENTTTSAAESSATLTVGDRGAGDRSYDGALDDVRIYNRAFSAEEAKRLYELGQ